MYYNNKNLSGNPVFTRIDKSINFDWGLGSPNPLIRSDRFSVRWQGIVISPTTEKYTFITQSDDGVRLWVNNKEIINNWGDHGVTTNKGSILLQAGQRNTIRMEYYEDLADAVAKLSWSTPIIPQQIISSANLTSQ